MAADHRTMIFCLLGPPNASKIHKVLPSLATGTTP